MIQKTYAYNILTTFEIKNYVVVTTLMNEKLKFRVDIWEKEVDPTLY